MMVHSDDDAARLMVARAKVDANAPGVYAPVPAAETHDPLADHVGRQTCADVDRDGVRYGKLASKRPARRVHWRDNDGAFERVKLPTTDDAVRSADFVPPDYTEIARARECEIMTARAYGLHRASARRADVDYAAMMATVDSWREIGKEREAQLAMQALEMRILRRVRRVYGTESATIDDVEC